MGIPTTTKSNNKINEKILEYEGIIFRNEKYEMDTEYGQQGRQRLLLSVVE